MPDDADLREIARLDLALAEARQEIERLRAQLEHNANQRYQVEDRALEIQKLLVLSTEHLSHLTRATLETLTPVAWEPQVRHSFGFDWYVPSAGADITEYPAELGSVFALAREHNCTWVRFDGDGPTIANLPTWDGDDPGHNTQGGR